MKIKNSDILQWTSALRSGKYEQIYGSLNNKRGYCLLGVACSIFIPQSQLIRSSNGKFLYGHVPDDQKSAPKWLCDISLDFHSKTGVLLTVINDVWRYSFDEIADLLELVYIHKAFD
jgi:hypothetical protein